MKALRNFSILFTLLTLLGLFTARMATASPVASESRDSAFQADAQPEKEPTSADTAEVGFITVDGVAQETAVSTTLPTFAPHTPNGPAYSTETEPNGTIATANPIVGTTAVIWGTIYPNADEDFYAFTATAGDRVYVAAMTSFSANSSTDSNIEIQDSVGTVLEVDNDDGSLGGLSSSIAGTIIPSSGTYYIRMRHNSATGQLRPYVLHFQLQSGSPTPEVESNNTTGTANPLPGSGWVSGSVDPAADVDFYSVALNAGDTVYLSLDMNPERDGTTWNGRVGLGLFGTLANQILVVNDASTTSPNSEAMFYTVKDTGTYYVYVDEPVAGGAATFTYNLSVTVRPAAASAGACNTYTNSTPFAITDVGTTESTITVPIPSRIADLDVAVNLTHTNMPDLDVSLISPQNNINGLFTDIGAAAETAMNLELDDEAGVPFAFTVVSGMRLQPELAYRLNWFDGEEASGTWTLRIQDDTAANTGTLNSWSITICEPPPLPSCPTGTVETVLYSTDFEANDGGYTHSGTLDEWEWGLPTFVPITTCNSGIGCWKTDLDSTYENSSIQNLLSPAIPITGTGVVGPVYLSWAQRYHMENASFDHAYVDVQLVGGASPTRQWEWLDATMNNTIGNPAVAVAESAGWGIYTRDISSYLGQDVELLFHVDSDTTVQLAGLAIDDVSIVACAPAPDASIVITKTVGLDPNVCASTSFLNLPFFGDDVTYCYEVHNSGNVSFNSHDLEDDQLGTILNNFPYVLAPGASAFITQSTTITATVTNTAVWTATNGVDTVADTDSATVFVPAPAPAVSLVKTVGTDPNVCASTDEITLPFGGGDVTYCYTIQNTGNITLTHHDLGDSELGTILTDFPFTLVPGASAYLTVTTNIVETTVNTATWTADLQPAPYTVSASDTDTAVVNVIPAIPDISISPTSLAATQSSDTQTTQSLTITNSGTGDLTWAIQEQNGLAPESGLVLYDNGPLVNSPGTGAGGADESMLQTTSLGMTTIGFGHQVVANNRVADDFTVTGAGWLIDDVVFYSYQTGSPLVSTITAVNLQIWDGPPGDSGSNVIFGDPTTNRMIATDWSGIYRVTETTSGNTTRPIMASVVDVNTFLPAGTYWLDWQTDGTLASGPWAPPVTINGQAITGNALQGLAGVWGPANDGGTGTPQQGFPFVMFGAPVCDTDIPWASTNPISGTTSAGNSSVVDVTFDSTGLTPGSYSGLLCVYSDDPDTLFTTITLTLDVEVSYGVLVGPDDATSDLPGTTVTYTLPITNTGDVTDTFDLAAAGVWTTTLSASSVTLAAGESADISVWVEIPGSAAGGDNDTATVTATSQGDGSVSDSADLTTTAVGTAVYGVTLSADDAITDTAGTTVTYTVYITNTGNTADTFDITTSGETWTTTVSAASITLNAGESGMVEVTVQIPANAADGDSDATTVTATSQSDASATDFATLTTTASVVVLPSYVIYLPVVMRP